MNVPQLTTVPLTRRGWSVAALTVACLVVAVRFGARTLNAIVVPGLIALLAAVLVVRLADPPAVDRTVPEDGFPGDGGTVRLEVAGDRLGLYTVRDAVPDGLSASQVVFEVPGDEATIEYDLAYDRRGAYELGPVTVTVTDVLGLARREFEVETPRSGLLVYPELADPPSRVLGSLDALLEREPGYGRDEFDRLREYERGDALRDVHWKSSAKRPDGELVVTEFYEESPDEALQIAVEASGSLPSVDAAASAAASVTVHLLAEGIEVGLRLPEETVQPGTDRDRQRAALAALARLSSSMLPESADADVRVTASDGDAVLLVGDEAVPFEQSTDASRPTEREVVP